MLARCPNCGVNLFSLRKEPALCRGCAPKIAAEVSQRKAEIRKALAELRYGDSGDAAEHREVALRHIEVLTTYQAKGIAAVRPEPALMMQRLKALTANAVPSVKEPARRRPPLPLAAVGSALPAERVGAERRARPRHRLELPVTVHPVGFEGRALDISEGGLFLQSLNLSELRKPLRLRIQTEQGDVEATGLIRRIEKRRETGSNVTQQGFAIQFTEVPKALAHLLERLGAGRGSPNGEPPELQVEAAR